MMSFIMNGAYTCALCTLCVSFKARILPYCYMSEPLTIIIKQQFVPAGTRIMQELPLVNTILKFPFSRCSLSTALSSA